MLDFQWWVILGGSCGQEAFSGEAGERPERAQQIIELRVALSVMTTNELGGVTESEGGEAGRVGLSKG